MTITPPYSNRAQWGLMALSALVCWLAYVGPGIWPLAFVSWAPFVLAIRGRAPKRAALIGLFGGTAMIGGGFYWLLGMLKTFSGFPWALCLLFAALLWTYQGGRYALTSWLAARAEQRGFSFGLAFVAAYATTELVYPLLFPYYWAAAMKDVPVMTQVADLGGPILVTVAVMGVNVGLAEVILALTKRRADKRVMMGAGALLAFTFVYGLVRVAMIESKMKSSEPIEVGIVQGNLGLMQQHTAADESLRRHRRATDELKKAGAELVVWSESSVDFAADDRQISEFYEHMVTRGLGVPLIFGTVVIHEAQGAGDRARDYNTALSTDERGKVTGRYDKEYLLAFGEYLPGGESFPQLYEMSPNSGRFTPGTKLDPLPITTKSGRHNTATLICYEDIIPSFVNSLVRSTDAELLVNITNDAWFGVTAEPEQHLALAQMRAIEHRLYLVRATNSGVSAIVDPLGRIVSRTEVRDVQKRVKEPDTTHATVRWMKSWTLFGLIGQAPWYGVALASVLMAFRRAREKPQ